MLKEYSEYLGERTNNDAEYEALIFALKKLKQLVGKDKAKHATVEVRMDSELVVRQMTGIYKIEEERLAALFMKVWNLKTEFREVSFLHVRREQNRDADRMVNQELDRQESKLF